MAFVSLRPRRLAVTILAVGAASLAGASVASGFHIPGATYTGSVTGGGTVTLTVSGDGSTVNFTAEGVPGTFGGGTCTFTSFNAPSTAITDHAFTRTYLDGDAFSGSFDSPQGAIGTLRIVGIAPTYCDTGTENWSATTNAPPVDNTPPDTIIDSGPPAVTNDPVPSFAFHATEPGSTFECRIVPSDFAPCTSPHTVAGLVDGDHTFEVRATDAAHNIDPSPAERLFRSDTTPPETTIDAGPSGPTTIATPTFLFSANEPASFECRVDGAPFSPCVSPLTSSPLAPGGHVFAVRATDAAGNAEPGPAERFFSIQSTTPVPIPTPTPTPTPTPSPSPSPSTPAGVSLTVRPATLASVLTGGLKVVVTCPAPCTVSGRLLLDRRTAKKIGIAATKTVVVGRGARTLRAAGKATVVVKLTAKASRGLRKVRGKTRFTLRTEFGGGVPRHVFSRTLTLARRGALPSAASPALGVNHAPVFPSPVRDEVTTHFEYDGTGRLSGASTTITSKTPATDIDGDPLVYAWTATNGSIGSRGLSATWRRVLQFGQPADGDVVLTASDGRRGSASHTFRFR